MSVSNYVMLEGFISLWVMTLSLIHLENPTIENDIHRNKALFNPWIENDLKRKTSFIQCRSPTVCFSFLIKKLRI
ncbi:hypothetical protein Peur_028110 [Populus x canadensis]